MKYLIVVVCLAANALLGVGIYQRHFYVDSVLDENFVKVKKVLEAHEARLNDIKPLPKAKEVPTPKK